MFEILQTCPKGLDIINIWPYLVRDFITKLSNLKPKQNWVLNNKNSVKCHTSSKLMALNNSVNFATSSRCLELLKTFSKNSVPSFSYSVKINLEQATHWSYLTVAGKISLKVDRNPLMECGTIPKMQFWSELAVADSTLDLDDW